MVGVAFLLPLNRSVDGGCPPALAVTTCKGRRVVTVRLYLVQHGQAKSETEDPERPLTDQGTDEVARVAHQAVDVAGVRPARVVHSGKTRARQTAQVWARLLGVGVEAADGLAPNDDPRTWAERLGTSSDDLLLVGHLPHLGRLAALLVNGTPDSPLVRFRPGGVVGLDRADTGWMIWVVGPPEAV
jgi:phosphohistidine phosphatase